MCRSPPPPPPQLCVFSGLAWHRGICIPGPPFSQILDPPLGKIGYTMNYCKKVNQIYRRVYETEMIDQAAIFTMYICKITSCTISKRLLRLKDKYFSAELD